MYLFYENSRINKLKSYAQETQTRHVFLIIDYLLQIGSKVDELREVANHTVYSLRWY